MLVLPLLTVSFSLQTQKAYATDYTLTRDESSCTALEELGATTTWVGDGNTVPEFESFSCYIDGTLTIPFGDTLSIPNTGVPGTVFLIIKESATVINNGQISADDSRAIFNSGTINNNGVIDGTGIDNSGVFDNAASGTVNILQFNVILNEGTTFTNQGTINIQSDGYIYNTASIDNYGTININSGGRIWGGGSINNYGAIYNEGEISDGTVTNHCDAEILGTGTVNAEVIDACNTGDTEPPQVTFNVQDKKGRQLSDGGTTNSKDIRIEFTTTDNVGVTSVECSLDGPGTTFDKQFSPCTSPIELSKLAKGTYTFTVVATDAAENEGTYTFKWIVKQP